MLRQLNAALRGRRGIDDHRHTVGLHGSHSLVPEKFTLNKAPGQDDFQVLLAFGTQHLQHSPGLVRQVVRCLLAELFTQGRLCRIQNNGGVGGDLRALI